MKKYTWKYIQKYPKQTKRLSGIDYQQLEQFMALGKFLHQKNKSEIEKIKIRINQLGSKTPPKLSEEEQIVLILVYLRHHLNFQILGLMFHISESTAHNMFTYWQKLFEGELPPSLLEQVKKCQKEKIIIEQLMDYELIVDGAQQPIERPKDYQEQKQYYSGKQKRHTLKSQFIVLLKAEDIVDVVIGQPGLTSDIKICRQTLSTFDSQPPTLPDFKSGRKAGVHSAQTFIGDKAYLGENQVIIPDKKPKNGELTENQIKENKASPSRRIFVGHLI